MALKCWIRPPQHAAPKRLTGYVYCTNKKFTLRLLGLKLTWGKDRGNQYSMGRAANCGGCTLSENEIIHIIERLLNMMHSRKNVKIMDV